MLTSSTAAEPGTGETAWVSGTTYAVGDVRIRATTHRKYTRLVAGAGTALPEADPTNWLDSGPTNKWAMFDVLRNSATVLASGPLTVEVAPTVRIDSIALVGLLASSALIEVRVSGVLVYSKTLVLNYRNTNSWTSYFFGRFGQQRNAVVFGIPLFYNAVITVTVVNTSGGVSVGALVLGVAQEIGTVLSGVNAGALNFSKIDRDSFGNATLVPRRTVPKLDLVLLVGKSMVDSLLDLRDALNAAPAVWVGLPEDEMSGYFNALLILGIYKEFSILADQFDYARMTLQLEEI